MKSQRRRGVTLEDGKIRIILCLVTGEWADGTKVWMECDPDRNIIDKDKQYMMFTRGGWTEFVLVAC